MVEYGKKEKGWTNLRTVAWVLLNHLVTGRMLGNSGARTMLPKRWVCLGKGAVRRTPGRSATCNRGKSSEREGGSRRRGTLGANEVGKERGVRMLGHRGR